MSLIQAQELPATDWDHARRMEQLSAAIARDLPSVDCPVKHYFAHGTYTREMFIPAGTTVVGKIHRHSCINILSQGHIKVVTDEGEFELHAPHTRVSGPGVKKAVYAFTDCIWINVHPWEGEEDLELIEHEVIVPSYEALEQERRALLEEDV